VLAACGARPTAPAPPPPPAPHTEPLTDLAIAASLEWMIHLRLRDIAARAELVPAIAKVIPEARFAAFAAAHGGVDLRQAHELVAARYPGAALWLARTPFDPQRAEAAFGARVDVVDGRAIDRRPDQIAGGITRAWGRRRGERVQLAMLGRAALALEVARPDSPANLSPLRIAELLAEGRLKRAPPALHAPPLARAAELLGDAPARAFAPGPFAGEWARGFGGLLAGATAAALAARPVAGPPAGLAFTLVLTGAWSAGDGASTRLLAWLDTFGQQGLGRLLGLDHPLAAARARALDDGLVLEATYDAEGLAQGLHEAVEADIREIMSR
jgi:hypothetical protein